VLFASGDLAAGALTSVEPLWLRSGPNYLRVSPTADGRWLALVDEQQRLWAASFTAKDRLVNPCATRLGERPSVKPDQPANCLASPPTGRIHALAPLSEHELLLVGEQAMVRYSLRTGDAIGVAPLPRSSSALLSTDAQALLLLSTHKGRPRAELLPVNAKLLGAPSLWRHSIEQLTGYAIGGARLVPLQPAVQEEPTD